MRLTQRLTVLGLLAVLAPAGGCTRVRNVVSVTDSQDRFHTFHRLIQEANLEARLSQDGPYTVFAPTERAFDRLDPVVLRQLRQPQNVERLRTVVMNHVVAGRVDAQTLRQRQQLNTLGGRDLRIQVETGLIRVDGATVVESDIRAWNGVIHAIDAVILE